MRQTKKCTKLAVLVGVKLGSKGQVHASIMPYNENLSLLWA